MRRTRAGTVVFAERVDTLYNTVVGEGRFTVNVFFIVPIDSNWTTKIDRVKFDGKSRDIK